MANVIKHRGIVENIEGNLLKVRIVQTSACAGCGAKGYCSSAEVRENEVEVMASDASAYRLGDDVWVMCEMSVGRRAVWWAFAFPFLILLASLCLFLSLDCGELWAAMFSLFLLVPYYYIMWLFRKRLERQFSFSVQPFSP
ncbi:MAG TPA: SoxR reducing system RseC family protein [Candidatus Bacteroides merdipullorum]|uniref:SoxR reducing system RseC family protein n=1 Tax=Candidatus Bacteroides merdipullorum TaxID=2838474 RepID=A0A9D2CX48_9BACE|nr:SoxR reducing system RseC family protein [Candidatus Bacteroides merdipullorum]